MLRPAGASPAIRLALWVLNRRIVQIVAILVKSSVLEELCLPNDGLCEPRNDLIRPFWRCLHIFRLTWAQLEGHERRFKRRGVVMGYSQPPVPVSARIQVGSRAGSDLGILRLMKNAA